MASQTQGIQQLLSAEKRAAEKVKNNENIFYGGAVFLRPLWPHVRKKCFLSHFICYCNFSSITNKLNKPLPGERCEETEEPPAEAGQGGGPAGDRQLQAGEGDSVQGRDREIDNYKQERETVFKVEIER